MSFRTIALSGGDLADELGREPRFLTTLGTASHSPGATRSSEVFISKAEFMTEA